MPKAALQGRGDQEAGRLLALLVAIASWFVIVITGRQPAGLQKALYFCLSFTMRAYALMYLLTETYPPFDA